MAMRSNHRHPSNSLFGTLVTGFAMLLILSCSPSHALAAAPTPSLESTNPASPGASLTPRIHGDPEGIITSVVTSAFRLRGGPIARSSEPGNLITIYTDPNCTGAIAAEGTAELLEGEGIQVTVLPDTVTDFYATETNITGVSGCSKGLEYQQVSTAPVSPTFSTSTPASGANENFPRLSGNAAAKSNVTIFADPTCSNAVGSGSAAEFSVGGIQVHVADNTATTFYAIASIAGFTSSCSSSSISYQEITPPEQPSGGGGGPGGEPPVTDPPGRPKPPQLRTIPGGIANDPTPVITGGAPGAMSVRIYGSSDCKGAVLAKGTVAQLQVGFPVQIVPNTTVAFYGKATDGGGDESACSSVPAIYTDDSISPKTRITVGPGVKTLKHTVVFRFADTTGGPDTSFLCKVDRKPWKPCHAPLKLKKLGHKRHVLKVKAYDAAGNREKKGVKRSFQVVSGR
jgi:hypothetical protein